MRFGSPNRLPATGTPLGETKGEQMTGRADQAATPPFTDETIAHLLVFMHN
jgi:hypothetical protein